MIDQGISVGTQIGLSVFFGGAFMPKIDKSASNVDERIHSYAYVAPGSKTLEVRTTKGEVLEPAHELSADEARQITNDTLERIYTIKNKGANKGNLLDTIKYAGYDMMFDFTGTDTILKKLNRASDEQKRSFLNFITNNPVALSTPYGESELSELFLEDISISEFKDKWAEFSQKSMSWARANPRDEIAVIDTSIAPNYTYNEDTGEFELTSGDPNSDYQIGGIKLKDLKSRNAKPSQELSEEEKQKAKQEEIDRNNRMLMRKYNGAKSLNINDNAKNEILRTFFEEFLKKENPLAFLEIMKKTNIKA